MVRYAVGRTRDPILGWLLLFHLLIAWGVAIPADQCDDCIQIARNALECPHLPDFSLGSSMLVPSAQDGPPQFTCFLLERRDGSFDGEIWVRHDTHLFARMSSERPAVDYKVETLGWRQVMRNAEDVVDFIADGDLRPLMQLQSTTMDVTREGWLNLRFAAQVRVLDVDVWLPRSIDVGIAVDTGQVLRVEASDVSGALDPLEITPSPGILKQCRTIAGEKLRMAPDELWLSDAKPTHHNSSSLHPVWDIVAAPHQTSTSLSLPSHWVVVTFERDLIVDATIQELPTAWHELSEEDSRAAALRFFGFGLPEELGAARL